MNNDAPKIAQLTVISGRKDRYTPEQIAERRAALAKGGEG
jgi:hypothetical protein